MDLIGGIFILAVASLVLTSICLGFVICGVIVLWRRDERKPKGMAEIDRTAESKLSGTSQLIYLGRTRFMGLGAFLGAGHPQERFCVLVDLVAGVGFEPLNAGAW